MLIFFRTRFGIILIRQLQPWDSTRWISMIIWDLIWNRPLIRFSNVCRWMRVLKIFDPPLLPTMENFKNYWVHEPKKSSIISNIFWNFLSSQYGILHCPSMHILKTLLSSVDIIRSVFRVENNKCVELKNMRLSLLNALFPLNASILSLTSESGHHRVDRLD